MRSSVLARSSDTDFLPFISPHVCVSNAADELTLDAPRASYRYTGRAAELMRQLLPKLHGQVDAQGLGQTIGCDLADLWRLFGPIVEDRYLSNISPIVRAADGEEQLEAYFELCDHWAKEIFSRPFWTTLLDGTAPANQVLGWGIEFYHRTVGADEHNELSVRYCSNEDIRSALTEHFHEEMGHGEMFLDGLQACGFHRASVPKSAPLPSTRALIEYMNHLAKTDSIGYLGCYGVLHSPRVGQTAEAVAKQFAGFMALYPYARGLIGKICEHALLDVQLGHDQIHLEHYIRDHGALDAKNALTVIGAAHGMVSVFCRFFDGIFSYYRSPGAQLPRPPTCSTSR